MSKDPMTAERFAVDAMTMAIGALKAKRVEGDGTDHVVAKLTARWPARHLQEVWCYSLHAIADWRPSHEH